MINRDGNSQQQIRIELQMWEKSFIDGSNAKTAPKELCWNGIHEWNLCDEMSNSSKDVHNGKRKRQKQAIKLRKFKGDHPPLSSESRI